MTGLGGYSLEGMGKLVLFHTAKKQQLSFLSLRERHSPWLKCRERKEDRIVEKGLLLATEPSVAEPWIRTQQDVYTWL